MINSKKQRIIDAAALQGKEAGHIMSKSEAKLLRKLMAEHNLTKEEVLDNHDFRKQLSATQVGKEAKMKPFYKKIKYIRQCITKELRLPKEHPLVIQRVNEEIKRKSAWPYFFPWYIQNYTYKGEL